MHAVKLLTGPRLGVLMVTNWATQWLLTGPRHVRTIKNRGFKRFLVLSYHFVFFCVQLFANFLKIAFSKTGCNLSNFSV